MLEPDRPILFDREALIAALNGDERITAIRAAVEEAEEEWTRRLGHMLLHSKKPVDQRNVDYMRGYFAGAKYWLGARMSDAQIRLALQAAAETPEEDEA